MATTTNYGWTTPDDTDLVKDGAAAIRTLGSSVDTTTKNLNPETTTGDISYRSATANTNTRLALGTAGQVLTVNSGETAPEWKAASGKVVAIANTQTGAVATGTTVLPSDNTIPQNTEGDQYMSLSYTPTNSSNQLRIDVSAYGSISSNSFMNTALFQDSVADALAANASYANPSGATNQYLTYFTHTMTAGTTSAITFKVRIGPDSPGTFTFNGRSGNRIFGGVGSSSITVTEYTP
jgi:hypothetical protein